jgi:hypothetical protein
MEGTKAQIAAIVQQQGPTIRATISQQLGIPISMVEVHNLGALETMIRLKTPDHGPRYFMMKLSEQLLCTTSDH